MSKMTIKPVENLKQALQMRNLRNECRFYMTYDTSKISFIRQVIWFYTSYLKKRAKGSLYAFVGYAGNTPVSYGLIRAKGDGTELSIGVGEKFRGMGFGEKMMKFLTKNASKPIYLHVLPTNGRAINLYLKLGYEITTTTSEILYMEKR